MGFWRKERAAGGIATFQVRKERNEFMQNGKFFMLLLAGFAGVFFWSGIEPKDRFTWFLEVAPAMIGLLLLVTTYSRFPLTRLTYVLIFLHAFAPQ